MSASMAEVLAEHGGFEFDAITNPKTVTCFCQKWTVSWESGGVGYVDAVRKLDAAFWAHQEAVLAAAGYGKLEAPSRELKFLRGERKTIGKELDHFESQGHTTVNIKYLRRYLGRRPE